MCPASFSPYGTCSLSRCYQSHDRQYALYSLFLLRKPLLCEHALLHLLLWNKCSQLSSSMLTFRKVSHVLSLTYCYVPTACWECWKGMMANVLIWWSRSFLDVLKRVTGFENETKLTEAGVQLSELVRDLCSERRLIEPINEWRALLRNKLQEFNTKNVM